MQSQHFQRFKSTHNSYFISFEGIEGSGKTTQIEMLAKLCQDQGYNVLCLREPGGTIFGEGLRSAILNSSEKISPLAEAHLFASSRAQLLNQKILPHLEQKNSLVIVDRYIDSSIAYQGNARGLGMDTILDIHKHSPLNILPQITFYLKIDLQTSMQRQQQRGNEKDYFEKENHKFYTSLIDGYDKCAKEFSQRIKTINAQNSIDEIFKVIKEEMSLLWK